MENKREKFKKFSDFYPFYLSEHGHRLNRRLHFSGTLFVLLILIYTLLTQRWTLLWLLPIFGYSFAWVGHFFVEKNRPATFRHPFYSLISDFIMFKDILIGKIKF